MPEAAKTMRTLLAVACVAVGLSACDNTSGSPGEDHASTSDSKGALDRPGLTGLKAVCEQSLRSVAKSTGREAEVTWTWPSGSSSDNVRCYIDGDSAVSGDEGAKAVMWVEIVPDLLAGKQISDGFGQADDCTFLAGRHNMPKTDSVKIAGQAVCTGTTKHDPGTDPGAAPGYESTAAYRSRGMIITAGTVGYMESDNAVAAPNPPAVSLVEDLQAELIKQVVNGFAKAI